MYRFGIFAGVGLQIRHRSHPAFPLEGRIFSYAHLWQAKYSAPYAKERTQGRNEYGGGKDEHSLEREHVNGVVMNTDAWYDLFDVKPGDKFYLKPEERTHIW